MALDIDTYRERAERFSEELDREYYLHLAGHKRELEIAPIYERHAALFSRGAVGELREAVAQAGGGGSGEGGRRARYLLEFAVEGHLGLATHAQSARLAELEAALELEFDSERISYRGAPIVQANEPDAERREAISEARDELLVEHLNPLHLEVLERSRELARELGWESYREMCAELSGIDLERLAGLTRSFLSATDAGYAGQLDPELRRHDLPALGELRRSDLPRFFRAAELDSSFPKAELVAAFTGTLAGLGVNLGEQANVHLDTDSRPTKSPRAFCSTPRVPDEVYLVVAPMGGRDDYAALFHEGGHAEHYAHADRDLPFEFRHLGDNSVTESFAFLLEGLTSDSAWLETRLGVEDPEPVTAHAHATKLVFLRRYAAKLDYELELHGSGADLGAMPARYAELLSAATGVAWPQATWVSDVDPGFYVARYLRAWALETAWRRSLTDRFGERWFESPEAGRWLRDLWSRGQSLLADELLAESTGEELDFTALAAELAPSGGRDRPAS